MTRKERIEGGVLGALVGDACGVPYEFRDPGELPSYDELEMEPPSDFVRSYAQVPLGTWSDDGAQALCLMASLLDCGGLDVNDFARRLVLWRDEGYMAVDGYVFDIGIQTGAVIQRLKSGVPASGSGLRGERNNGNGSLMRCLPLALLHRGSDANLVQDAHRQSEVTHAHPRSQVCCALYCLWARYELQSREETWCDAVAALRGIYPVDSEHRHELEDHIRPDSDPCGTGTGYVVDCLLSARAACLESSYEAIVKTAIAFGNDTDTTACVAGGIAGLRHGVNGIPSLWLTLLRGEDILSPLLERLRMAES